MASNLVVKNAAGVDKTFTVRIPAAGDKSVAEWADLTSGTSPNVQNVITYMTERNGNAARKGHFKVVVPVPFTSPDTGLVEKVSRWEAICHVTVPDNCPDTVCADGAAYIGNALALTIVKALTARAVPAT